MKFYVTYDIIITIKIKEVHYFMYANRKLRRSNLNGYYFVNLQAIYSEERKVLNRDDKIRNVSVNSKCIKRRKADRGH